MLTPWLFGSVGWESQRLLLISSLGLLSTVGVYCGYRFLRKSEFPKVPFVSWLFVVLAIYAFIQSGAMFERDSNSFAPPSVALQKWGLGEGEVTLANERMMLADFNKPDSNAPCDSENYQSSKLAWSVEPLHTRGAIGALLVCALMTFCGTIFFSDKQGQVTLFIAMTAIGVAVACFGFLGAYSYRSENILGLRTGSSFACFKSKNSAGAYLNICLAASMGLVTWAMLNLRRKDSDIRYKVSDATILMKLRGVIEDFLSELNTPQIAAVICSIVIGISVVVSQCRGAVMAALTALIATVLLVGKKRSSGTNAIAPTLIILASLAASAAFQLDENSYERLETLAEFDLEADSISGRVYIWSVALEAIKFFGLLGSGLGTFHYAYLPFQHPNSPGWFYHAESLYLQIGVELGYLGLFTIIAAIFFVGTKLQSRVPTDAWKAITPIRVAGAFLFFSQVVHSSVDFGLILPALSIPACLLLGATLQSLGVAKQIAEKKRDQRALKDSPSQPIAYGKRLAGVVALFSIVIALGVNVKPSLDILAATERLDNAFKELSTPQPSERKPGALESLLETWTLTADDLQKSPDALRLLAQAAIQDLRVDMLIASPSNDWNASWRLTDPLLLQLGLDREKSPDKQSQILDVAGGNKAIDTMKLASKWYSLAHARSPLDWRLVWGRCRTTLTCSRENMAALLSPVVQLGQHATNQLIESSLLFRKQLNDAQVDRIWQQAMKTKPSTATQTAKMMIEERDLQSLDISVFPQRADILRTLATSIFTSANYPEIHRDLWMRARDVLDDSEMSRSAREIWLADAARALGEVDEEIKHLRVATTYEPSNYKLACRLAMKLLDVSDVEAARSIYNKLRRTEADAKEVKDLGIRLGNR
jgi:O-antigen ligase